MTQGVLIDLSGTVYIGNTLLPRALAAIDLLHQRGIPIRYITNTSRSPRLAIPQKLHDLGLSVPEDEIFTAPRAVADYLRSHRLSPWLLVHPAIQQEFAGLVDQQPSAVVIGDAEQGFSYANLNQAFRLLLDGALLLAVGDTRYFKEDDGMSLDVGPFVKALEYAAGCEAIILGKPSSMFFHAAATRLGCRPQETVMIGDDVFSDVNGALKAGMKAVLVQTGKYRQGDERQIRAPGACVCADLYEAVQMLCAEQDGRATPCLRSSEA